MTVCEYCGFDSEEESVRVVGAPCGIDECPIFTCCFDQWLIHKKKYHKNPSIEIIKAYFKRLSKRNKNVV